MNDMGDKRILRGDLLDFLQDPGFVPRRRPRAFAIGLTILFCWNRGAFTQCSQRRKRCPQGGSRCLWPTTGAN